MGSGVFCRVLGPVAVERDGIAVELGGRLQRRLLAALLVTADENVSDSWLTELVWGGAQPADPNALRVVVSRARAALGPRLRDRLERTSTGYRFRIASVELDRSVFVDAVATGLDRLADNDPHAALATFEVALALWRGSPWTELDDALTVIGPRSQLTELLEVAQEERQAARLAIGHTAASVAELSDLAVAAPFRERRWELLALGLYRAGRQTQALAELRRVHSLLTTELGIEPGPALRELEQRILRHDPGLLLAPVPRPALPDIREPAEPDPPATSTRPLTSFIERTRELALLESLRTDTRLVTVVGPVGVGKTRLALEYTARHTDPTWLVRLADAPSAADVASITAAALGVAQLGGDTVALVARALGERAGLLVLDNCEHVVDSVAALALRLLDACPRLRVLATSRQPLDVGGEHLVGLAPLPVLDSDGGDGPAVRLLLDRVRAVRPGWKPTTDERAAARRICALLDGLPLAIELAAARERAFGLAGLAGHLATGPGVLGTTQRGSITPHASLTAALAWSIDRLDPADRALLLRLWPFEGGFRWPAAAAVQIAATGGESTPVLAGLASLVDRSVVMSDIHGGTAQYRLLEVVRQYCRQLDPDPAATAEAHAAWVRRFVAERTARVITPRPVRDVGTLREELPNIRAGIAHDLATRPLEALRTASAMEFIWSSLGVLTDGVRLIRTALGACPDAPVVDRVGGLLALSICAYHAGDPAESMRLADEALELLGRTGDRSTLVFKALNFRGGAGAELGDQALLADTCARFAAAEAELGEAPAWNRTNALLCEAGLQLVKGHRDEGERLLVAARELASACGYVWGAGTADLLLSRTLVRAPASDVARARRAAAAAVRALGIYTAQDNMAGELGAIYAGAHALARLGRIDAAVTVHCAAIEHARLIGVSAPRLARLAGDDAERVLADAPTLRPRTDLETRGRQLRWSDMHALFRAEAAAIATTTPAPGADLGMAPVALTPVHGRTAVPTVGFHTPDQVGIGVVQGWAEQR
ncbi:MAG TPA: BTAD domain-containing putative transcriptional regulator [Pseudonocardia sp.]|nr:BTAD domain-containing putative transcriptional regulator [Pseudonocardia sp.]